MITGPNPYIAASTLSFTPTAKPGTNGQNLPDKATKEESIAEVGFKTYVREMQMEKLQDEARAHALQKLKLTEEKLEKVGAVSPQKLTELEANIQSYITEYLQTQVKNELIKEAHDQGKPGYRQGALMDLSV